MEEDTEYKKLPVEERCVHKLWKARVDGYEEANKIFREIDDEKSMEWSKFTGLIKKFVVDSNAMAQEKGLEATLVFVENCAHAGKTVGEVMSGIVTKCIAAPKTNTKKLSLDVAMMYIEIEKPDSVIEELIKGMEHKNPKIVAGCVAIVTKSLHEFGSKVISVKPIIKKIGTLLTDRDKGVRDEGKLLAIEIFRWIGPALKPQLASLAPVLITELDGEFDKLKGGNPTPIRFLKSQQQRQVAVAQAAAAAEDDLDADGNDDAVDFEPIDPMDLIDPVDILSKLPKDFYEKLEAKKWQERKESLEALDNLLKNPKLETGDYGELIRALKKILSKDSNVVLVAMAGKSIAAIAKGLGKKFQPYAGICVSAIFEKFKEKKTNVVMALRDAIDSMYPSTNLEQIQEDILEALNNKNPAVKSETASFLARAFSKTLPTILTKKLLKSYVTALLKTLNEPDPIVRDCAADAIGTLMKLVSEKVIGPFLTDVDALKMQKIKESCEKAVIHVKIPNVKKERPATVPAKKPLQKGGSVDAKPVQRPATSNAKKTAVKKQPSQGSLAKSASSVKVLPTEINLTPEEVDEQGSEIISTEILTGLADANWKTRLSSVESFSGVVNDLESKCGHSQILVRLLIKKPGLKDTNLQVVKIKFEIIKTVIDKMGITVTAADYICNDVTEKLSDTKCSAAAAALLTSIAESISLEYVIGKVLEFAFDQQKSPKVQQESLVWVNGAIKEFGFHVNVKQLIEEAKKAVQMSNPAVRSAGVTLLGTMFLYMGTTLSMFFDSEKPALKQQIQTEFDKYADQKPAAPIRSMKNNKAASSPSADDFNEDDEDNETPPINIADLLPRIDISSQITEALLAEMADKNWKVRNEGLVKLQGILTEAKLIKSTIGDLSQALSQRLIDSNAKIAQTSIAICQQLANVMGPGCKQHVRVIFPGLVHGLGDGKVFIRTASIQAINALGEQGGFKEFFESEMIADAMKNGSPVLRSELWTWIAVVLPDIPPKSISKDELLSIMPHLYTNIIDRNADVRKNANDAVLGMMIHLGYDSMFKAVEKQKPSSKKDIQAALDKARPNLPVKPLPKNKQQAPILEEANKTAKVIPGQKRPVTAVKTAVKSKKEEEVDTSPILAINSTKNQRLIDEQKLRVLKWTFTQPREEFIELLREQMNTANVNKGLTANMFHEDFRYHLKVIDSLIDDLPSNEKSLICNLDLILKWLSLRFYDTNPSVLLKGLEYLNMVFQMLITSKYVLAENEGSCFIPHLLIKIGDPKDAVRNGVRSLLRQICFIYPFTKVFVYIMEGLKSKNARQRTECLDELGYLIETYGLTVCQPSTQSALKEIARHISDRDNSVRSAALNTIVQAYFLAGEKIYKLIGQMTEKDLSMLDERIKRSKKTRKPTVEILKLNASGSPPQELKVEQEQEIVEEELIPAEELSSVVTRAFEPQKVSGPFGTDPEIITEIEMNWIRSNQKKETILPNIDISCLYEPLRLSSVNGVIYPADRLKLMTSHTLESHNHSFTTSPPQANHVTSPVSSNLQSRPRLDPNLLRIIRGIGSVDSITARAAMNELGDILDSPEKQAVLRDYEDLYIQSVLQQFKNLSIQPLNEAFTIYQPLLSSTFSFFDTRNLGKNLGIVPLKNIMSCLLGLMADQKLTNADNGQCTKVINSICLKILDRANFTYLNCALIRLLKETCSNTGLPKFTDLLMKCIWRNVKIMPERSNDLEYGEILLEVHEFMLLLPTTWWQQRPSDTPLRTVKTIIHNMAKIKGTQILQHLNNIPIHSEIHAYLLKILKNFQKDGNLVGSPQRANLPAVRDHSNRLEKSTHETIAHIFKLIADPETAKEGISRLYDFKLKNPAIDINPSLVGTSPSFQKYIEDGLAKLEREGGDIKRTERSSMIGIRTTPNAKDPVDSYLSKLNSLKLKANLLPVNLDDAHSLMDNKITDENLNHNQIQTKFSLMKKEITPNISDNRRELLQQKLAQMKLQK